MSCGRDAQQEYWNELGEEYFIGEEGYPACPRCGCALENFSSQEGGWCSECEEWFPPDLILEGF